MDRYCCWLKGLLVSVGGVLVLVSVGGVLSSDPVTLAHPNESGRLAGMKTLGAALVGKGSGTEAWTRG